MSAAPTITEVVMTGSAAPSQWELMLSDGRVAYVRYRHGQLSVGIGQSLEDAVDSQLQCTLDSPFEHSRECSWEEAEPYVIAAIAGQPTFT